MANKDVTSSLRFSLIPAFIIGKSLGTMQVQPLSQGAKKGKAKPADEIS